VEILQVAGVAVSGLLLVSIVRAFKPELAIYVVISTVLVILIFSMEQLTHVFQFLKSIYDDMTYGKEYFPIIIKVLVVAYLADFTAQLCNDAGESAIGNKVELAGKIIIFYISLPILVSILKLVNSIL
jgi:stage III sporulation protein AD